MLKRKLETTINGLTVCEYRKSNHPCDVTADGNDNDRWRSVVLKSISIKPKRSVVVNGFLYSLRARVLKTHFFLYQWNSILCATFMILNFGIGAGRRFNFLTTEHRGLHRKTWMCILCIILYGYLKP